MYAPLLWTTDNVTAVKHLFAELFLTQLVERVELLGKRNVLLETARRQLHANDDGAVRHHHGACAEVDLQILGQLLTTGVARVLQTKTIISRKFRK